jgi:PST family polysaccharide transporter
MAPEPEAAGPSRPDTAARPGVPDQRVPDETLARQVTSGLRWSLLNNVLGKLGTFAAGLVLARVLDPRDFGVFAAALAVMQIFLGLNDVGLSAAVVRWPGDVRRITGTAATLVLATSALTYAVYCALVPLFAHSLRIPEARTLLYVLGLALVVDGAFAVHSAVLTRELLQRQRTITDLCNLVVTTLVTLSCAWAGLGPWSLVWGRLAGNVAAGVVIVRLTPVRIRPALDRPTARALLGFGVPLAGSGLLTLAMLNADYLVVGRLLGPVALGYYLMAFNLASWPINMFAFAVARVSLAGFAELASDRERLARAYVSSLRLLAAVVLPACVLLAVLAEPTVRVLYGDRWAPAAAALQPLALMGAVRVLAEFSYDLFIADARPRAVLAVQAAWTLTLLPALWMWTARGGIRGTAWAHLVVALAVTAPLTIALLRRHGIAVTQVARALRRPVLACVPLVVVAMLVTSVVHGSFAQLVLAGLAAGAAYAALTVPIWRDARRFVATGGSGRLETERVTGTRARSSSWRPLGAAGRRSGRDRAAG